MTNTYSFPSRTPRASLAGLPAAAPEIPTASSRWSAIPSAGSTRTSPAPEEGECDLCGGLGKVPGGFSAEGMAYVTDCGRCEQLAAQRRNRKPNALPSKPPTPPAEDHSWREFSYVGS